MAYGLWLMVHHYLPSPICYQLFPQTQSPDDVSVALRVLSIQIRQVTPALTDQLQQSPPRMLVVLVYFQVFRQLANPGSQQRNLYFWRTGIAGMDIVLLNDVCFFRLCQRHFR